MRLRDVIETPCGLRYMLDTLPLASGYSRQYFLDSQAFVTEEEISDAYYRLATFMSLAQDDNTVSLIHATLCSLKYIGNTLRRIAQKDTIDDIELYEVKHLLLTGRRTAEILERSAHADLAPDLSGTQEILSLLDPDGNGIDSFYIYDSYSPELARLRWTISRSADEQERWTLQLEAEALEAQIRENLCLQLSSATDLLQRLMESLAELDLSIAKAVQCKMLSLCIPTLSKDRTTYTGMFNPYVQMLLAQDGKDFTPIDLTMGDRPVVIIGANMGGKTVVLKTAALCQLIFAFGMGIPAQKAEIVPAREVFFVSDDAQDVQQGLSSFAAEMKHIDLIIKASESSGKGLVALVDEPARSTNPIEGTALARALVDLLGKRGVTLVLTTHYNLTSEGCTRLRVRGIENGKMNYRLCPAPDGAVPHEAINVAESLNISPEWLGEAKRLLKDEE